VTDAVELLRELIRVDTTNPPGNEAAAAELLRGYLEAAGVECRLYARVPERANLVARIPGTGGGPSLALLCHTDVVPADPAQWQHPPFGGDLVDGEIWGRGALDMKGQVAAAAAAVAGLAREGWRGKGDLVLIAAADEEVGTGFGLEWLCAEHPDAVSVDYAVNEGGGDRVSLGGRTLYLCATAEKLSSPVALKVTGRSGHASMPGIADNALVKAARYIDRLAAFAPAPRLMPETEGFLAALFDVGPGAAAALAEARALDPLAG
jgi:acetylornithine deacetylase/succinyl-diaminopimelate desuccinylase-like protein